MPDILTLKTPHFDLSVWTKEIDKAQALLGRTHAARGAVLPVNSLRFNPALLIDEAALPSGVSTPSLALPDGTTSQSTKPASRQVAGYLHGGGGFSVNELALPAPLFFENKLYEFEFLFKSAVNTNIEPVILHRLRGVEEAFHYKQGSLRGSINFGNDIGWFRLGVRYGVAGRELEQYVSFEVLPTKMAMADDLAVIHRDVDACYPLWRFSLAQKTDQ